MTAIFPLPAGSVRRVTPRQRMERLASIDANRMAEALTFLIGFDGQTFDAIMDATEPADRNRGDDDRDIAPFCRVCGEDLGIFLKWGTEWRHYSGDGEFAVGHIEVFDAGHDPVLAWRTVAATSASR